MVGWDQFIFKRVQKKEDAFKKAKIKKKKVAAAL
jgi:hypothetical protein